MDLVDKYLGESMGIEDLSKFARKQDPIQALDNIDYNVRKLDGILKSVGVTSLLRHIKNISKSSGMIRDRLEQTGV